ncbi:MAG: hypothetical protein JJT94_17525 [Bernardetiaceae bacterium]|nr:hypothetical protein [Bernardetiaceae bacterium]
MCKQKIHKLLLACGLLFFLLGCEGKESNSEYQSLYQLFSDLKITLDTQPESIYLFIPYRGCNTCVDSSKQLAVSHLDNSKMKVIFTSLPPRKILQHDLGDLLEHRNLYLDTDNLAFKSGLVHLHPMAVFTDIAGEIKDVRYVAPNTMETLAVISDFLD